MDIQEFSITPQAAGQINVHDAVITAKLIDGSEVVADFTGENAIHFPSVLSTLTAEQRAEVVGTVAQRVVFMKAGL